MSTSPAISVVMPFYNVATTVVAALKSVFRQTFTNYEVIAIDDGSSDDGYDRVAALRDSRIRLYRNDRNMGVATARNRALDLMRGEFMAPMDADDTCHPRRLEWTLRVMRENPRVGVCGGWMRIHRATLIPFVMRQPCKAASVKAMYLYGNPYFNGTLLLRRQCIEKHGIRYNESYQTGEDHGFCARLMEHTDGVNIPSVLLRYMWNSKGLTATRGAAILRQRISVFRPHLQALMGMTPTDGQLAFHAQLGNGAGAHSEGELLYRLRWLESILQANDAQGRFAPEGLMEATAMVWFRVCRNSAHLGPVAWRTWRRSAMPRYYAPHADEILSFFASMLKCKLARNGAHPQGALPE